MTTTTSTTTTSTTAESDRAHDLWVVQQGSGPDVLLIGGLGDPVESWQLQIDGLADSFRMTAFDNRGAGRSPLPDGPFTVESMADDAASVLLAAGIGSAHVVGFSGGSVIAQELAIRHPDLVRSLVLVSTWARVDPYFEAMGRAWRWMVTDAPTERAFLEAFFVWIYTRRAHLDGTVSQIVEESLAFPHAASAEAIQRTVDAFLAHETADRLPKISVPTLVLAGAEDVATPPRYGEVVADLIPGARFEVWEGEAHQPMQEAAGRFNRRVADFWLEVDASSRSSASNASGTR
jgi:pimeloyl-ACP methyl ester carboxylesterase